MPEKNPIVYCCELGDGSPSRPLTLLDLSREGARLQTNAPDDIPDRFTLLLKGERAALWRCSVVWRAEREVGIRFEHAMPKGAA